MDDFDILKVIEELKKVRKVFSIEADFQLEMAMIIRKMYKGATVLVEYTPPFDTHMYIDILVIINNKWYPIELKYKTKCAKLIDNGIEFNLKNHAAKNENCYHYINDIKRIEKIEKSTSLFERGYTVFLTNDLSYLKEPRSDSSYREFSIYEGAHTKKTMRWIKPKKGFKESITLSRSYDIMWHEYSKLEDETFMYTVSEIV